MLITVIARSFTSSFSDKVILFCTVVTWLFFKIFVLLSTVVNLLQLLLLWIYYSCYCCDCHRHRKLIFCRFWFVWRSVSFLSNWSLFSSWFVNEILLTTLSKLLLLWQIFILGSKISTFQNLLKTVSVCQEWFVRIHLSYLGYPWFLVVLYWLSVSCKTHGFLQRYDA